MNRIDVAIIGAGVIGLAIAQTLCKGHRSIIVLEKNDTFGQETSSRNSEIIHSGIYYPKDFLKTRFCIEGNRLLYEYCRECDIPHKKIGKLIVARNDREVSKIEELFAQGNANGIEDLQLLGEEELLKLEPNVKAKCGVFSPSAGILDSHKFMDSLESYSRDNNVIMAYKCRVIGIGNKMGEYKIELVDADGEPVVLTVGVIINAAGLDSDKIAQMAGIDVSAEGYKINYSKGEYFRVRDIKKDMVKHLIYPPPGDHGLGIHTVTDTAGRLKLGPNDFSVDELSYEVDISHRDEFYEAVKDFLPFLEPEDLSPDIAGIRPQLEPIESKKRDFIIKDEDGNGLPNFINLIGIESPGLTASLAIAKYVAGLVPLG
ncbi:MAG: NAD(P)/FAD-dependent oxidoreductase [Candidatus Omnitrophica bacterium]|nr:NAD(P)/FAD-dependent oxidoreductase [Candidatus Omnitrophota bacterium]